MQLQCIVLPVVRTQENDGSNKHYIARVTGSGPYRKPKEGVLGATVRSLRGEIVVECRLDLDS